MSWNVIEIVINKLKFNVFHVKILASRPKRLLIFINPNSGNGKSVAMYEEMVAPLFSVAGVKTEVIGINSVYNVYAFII